jgi:hypothetical protein
MDDNVSVTPVNDALIAIRETVGNARKSLGRAAVEAIAEQLGNDLKRVPIVGTVLAKIAARMLTGKDRPKASVEDVLEELERMSESSEALERGLDAIHVSLSEILGAVSDLAEIVAKGAHAQAVLLRPKYVEQHPVFDNELQFMLSNVGGKGLLISDIVVHCESAGPDTRVDLSVPAAPPLITHLKVHLSTREKVYKLFALNQEPEHVLESHGNAPEYFVIQMGCDENAIFQVRVHVEWKSLVDESEGVLVYPPVGKDPLEIRYSYAPGWKHRPTPEEILDPAGVLATLETRLRSLLSGIEAAQVAGSERSVDDALREHHVWGMRLLQPMVDAFRAPADYLGKRDPDRSVGELLDRLEGIATQASLRRTRS